MLNCIRGDQIPGTNHQLMISALRTTKSRPDLYGEDQRNLKSNGNLFSFKSFYKCRKTIKENNSPSQERIH